MLVMVVVDKFALWDISVADMGSTDQLITVVYVIEVTMVLIVGFTVIPLLRAWGMVAAPGQEDVNVTEGLLGTTANTAAIQLSTVTTMAVVV